MIRFKLSRYFVMISLLTFLGVFIFVVQSGYQRLMEPIDEAKSNVFTKPFNPRLDVSTLQLIEGRQEFSPDYLLPISDNSETDNLVSP